VRKRPFVGKGKQPLSRAAATKREAPRERGRERERERERERDEKKK